MNISTLEDDFEYQVKEIVQRLVDDYKDEDDSLTGTTMEDWLWNNKDELGKYFYEKVDEYLGMETVVEQIEL